jgi:exopolysaccharide biosynthesis protein
MKKNSMYRLTLIVICLGVLLLFLPKSKPQASPTLVQPSDIDIQYLSRSIGQSVVHTVLIPAQSHYSVTPALSQKLSNLESFAQKNQAVAALNGGYFDPANGKTTSIVVLQGKIVADPRQNERLMNNPNLAAYLDKILNRTEFRRYLCGKTVRYDIVLHAQPAPENCQLEDALGGGPGLLPEITSFQEGFLDFSQGKVIRDAIGSRQPNARTAVGITGDGSIVWVMVAQKPADPKTSGMSLQELSEFMKTLGVEKAMNLDGGSSSSLYYKGNTVYGKVNSQGNSVRRQVKSVLLIQKN